MPIHPSLLRGIYSHGFEAPSPIQQQAVAPMLQGRDILAQAPSGTGKTGAFSIGLLSRLAAAAVPATASTTTNNTAATTNANAVQHRPSFAPSSAGGVEVLVLEPTRELAVQTKEVIEALGRFLLPTRLEGHNSSFCEIFVGGTPTSVDVKKLTDPHNTRVAVAVGTPGRVLDLIRRGAMRVSHSLRVLVMDEADDLLSQGFADQIRDMLSFVPRDVQIGLFSATLPPDVVELTAKVLRKDAARVLVEPTKLTLEGIKQFHVRVEEEEKLLCIMDLYEQVSVAQSVIFVNSRRKASWMAEQLNLQGHAVSLLHADMAKGERQQVMDAFRHGQTRVLVTTDLIARGIDVQRVNIVINVDVPTTLETYLHRIGRSGRYGRKGLAITFVTGGDVASLVAIQKHYGTTIPELPEDFAKYGDEE